MGSTLSLAGRGRARMDRRGIAVSIAAGLINGVGMLTFFWSLTRLEASVASMIFSINPLATLTLLAPPGTCGCAAPRAPWPRAEGGAGAGVRGEKYTYRNVIRLALGLGGLYLLIGPGGQVNWRGASLVFVSICTSSIQLSLIQWYLQGYDSRSVTFYVTGAMMIVIVTYWLAQGVPWTDPGWRGWLGIVVLAVVSTYLARLLMVTAIRGIGSAQIALLTPLETLLTVIWALLFLGERLSLTQWLGGGLTRSVSGALLAVRRLARVRWRPEAAPPARGR